MAAGGYQVADLSDDEMAKLHVRYMVGGRPSKPLRERLYSFEFPESPGALLKFLYTLGTRWNITLFHYRSHGTDYGRVLAGFELAEREPEFDHYLSALGYECHDVTANPAFRLFLADLPPCSPGRIGRQAAVSAPAVARRRRSAALVAAFVVHRLPAPTARPGCRAPAG